MAAPLFKPFRALGYITDEVPFSIQRRGKETYVTVSVGKSWQIYNTAKITLVLVGPQLKHDITALASKGDLTFAAHGTTITECKRLQKTGDYRGHNGSILQLLVLGDSLLALDDSNQLLVWRIGSYTEPEARISFSAGFSARCLAHPDTYLNKVVVGSQQGKLQLWNFRAAALVHEFDGWGSPVKCISPSPALDVVGVGLADGRAILHNLRYDETVSTFLNASGLGTGSSAEGGASTSRSCACTSISFRTGAGLPLMAAGGGAGVITVWNLEERRLATIIKDAHDAPLVSLHFFAGEPLLMSSAGDNSLKQWVFDAADSSARLLKFRSGHAAPPTCLRHYGEGLRLLSAGRDRAFRVFSTIQDQQSRELSQRHAARRAKRLKLREAEVKLPRVLAMDACQVRERDWANVLTAHEGDVSAYTWRLQHFTLGEHVLAPPAPALHGQCAAPVACVALSSCGNFGLVGSAAGRVDRYNMQSGQHRGAYTRQGQQGAAPLNAHDSSVVGLAVDGCNRLLVSASLDGRLRVWGFKSQAQQAELALGAGASHLALHPGSALAAVALDDLDIKMFDVEAGRLVRRFRGHEDRITSLCISEDCRWLLSASMDGTVRCWDIPSAQCLQSMRLGAPVTALSLSPGQDLLATCHAELRGIYLWSNQMMFGDPSQLAPSEQVVDISLPTISSEAKQRQAAGEQQQGDGHSTSGSDESTSTAASSDVEGDEETDSSSRQQQQQQQPIERPYEARDGAGAPAPLAPRLVTLSLLPRAQVDNLVALDLIKARNKPMAPPKKPAAAPFFLPTVATLERNPVFDLEAARAEDEEAARKSRLLAGSSGGSGPQSAFLRLLRACADSKDYTSFVAHLRELSPAAIDRELRAMQLLEGAPAEEVQDVAALLEALHSQLQAATNFEFCQAVLQATLAVHGEAIMQQPLLRDAALRIMGQLKAAWGRVDSLLQGVRCMVDFFANLQM